MPALEQVAKKAKNILITTEKHEMVVVRQSQTRGRTRVCPTCGQEISDGDTHEIEQKAYENADTRKNTE